MMAVWSTHREQSILFYMRSSGAQQTLSPATVGESVTSHTVILGFALLLFNTASQYVV